MTYVYESEELSARIGIDVIWGRSNKRVDTYITQSSAKPICGIDPDHSVRPTPKYGRTYPSIVPAHPVLAVNRVCLRPARVGYCFEDPNHPRLIAGGAQNSKAASAASGGRAGRALCNSRPERQGLGRSPSKHNRRSEKQFPECPSKQTPRRLYRGSS